MSTRAQRRRRRLRYRLRISMHPKAWAKLVADEARQRAEQQRAAQSKPQPPAPVETAADRAARRREEQAAHHQRQHELMMSAIAEMKPIAAREAERDWEQARAQDDLPMEPPYANVTLSPSATPDTVRALLGGGR